MITKRKLIIVIFYHNSLNKFFKEAYGDQAGESVCECWGLKGSVIKGLLSTPFNQPICNFSREVFLSLDSGQGALHCFQSILQF